MKTGLFSLAGIALLQLTIANPHPGPFWRHLSHRHHGKRAEESSCATDAAIVTNTATAIATVTFEFEDVTVYVDDENKPVSSTTSYRSLIPKTAVPARASSPATHPAPALLPSPSLHPAPSAPQSPPSSAPAPAQVPPKQAQPGGDSAAHPSQPQAGSKPAPAQSSSSLPSPSIKGGSSSGPGFGSGISYSPYNSDNSCKSAQQVAKDLQQQASNYEVIRLYGTDCNQVASVIAATKGNVKLFLGIFDINSIQKEVQTISSAVNGNWGLVNAVSVGNELVNNGKASAGQVTAAIGTARSALKTAGYSGPVTTVDTMIAMKNNPSLRTASDFCAINCHAFFDGSVLPEGAGDFVKKWAQQVSEAADGKTVIVTESGWPTQGGRNSKAIASKEAHNAAISSLKSAFGGGTNLILYGMYNDGWKVDTATTYGCEKFWGIHGDAPS